MHRIALWLILVAPFAVAGPVALAEAAGSPAEMQARAQAGAMTPQRARQECWQSLGVGPNTPRNQYPGRLLPQVESCVAQKMRR